MTTVNCGVHYDIAENKELTEYYILVSHITVQKVSGYVHETHNIGIHFLQNKILTIGAPRDCWTVTDLASGRAILHDTTSERAYDRYISYYSARVEKHRNTEWYKQKCDEFNEAVLKASGGGSAGKE